MKTPSILPRPAFTALSGLCLTLAISHLYAQPMLPGLEPETPLAPIPEDVEAGEEGADTTSEEPAGDEGEEAEDPRTRMYEGMVDVQDEKYLEAIPKLEWVIEQDPTLLGAWESLGWAYWLTDQEDEAVELWTRLMEIAPNEPLGYNLLAQVATRRSEFRRAEALYQKSLELNPAQFEVEANLGRVLLWGGKREASIDILRNLFEKDPQRTDLEIDLAWALYANEQYTESLQHWNSVIEIIPGHDSFLMARANIHILMGMFEEAWEDIRAALEANPENVAARQLLIALAIQNNRPFETVDRLEQLLEDTEDTRGKIQVALQLAVYMESVREENPGIFSQEDVVAAGRRAWRYNKDEVDAALFYAESLVLNKKYRQAGDVFTHILEDLNPHNDRARWGMFEVYMGRNLLKEAEEQLVDNLRDFNPENPFRHTFWARLHFARGNFPLAMKALDRLEREGARGAVFGLLYHGLSPSEFSDMPSVRQLREQTMALRRDGWRFMTPNQLDAYFQNQPEPPAVSEDTRPLLNRVVEGVKYSVTGDKPEQPATLKDFSPDKVVIVTFDDALRTSFRYGTVVAEELDTVFTMFVGVGDVYSRTQRFVAHFWEIRDYYDTGHWEIQSHLWDGGQLAPIEEDGKNPRLPLPNRIWLPEMERMETLYEYQQRIRKEFARSKRVLSEELDIPEDKINAAAYPYGEIGQERTTNIDVFDVTDVILNEAEISYEMGFLQNRYGYVMKGDNPLMYKRYEPYRHASGRHVLRQAYLQHPVYVARRMRAEIAALDGKYDLAMENVELLRRDGYPEEDLRELTEYVNRHLARLVRLPDAVEDTMAGEARNTQPLLEIQSPFIGVDGRTVRANNVIDEEEVGVFAGVNLNRRTTLQLRATRGEIDQTFNTQTNRVVRVFESSQATSSTRTRQVIDGSPFTVQRNREIVETLSFQSNRVDEVEFNAEFQRQEATFSYIHDSGSITLGRIGRFNLEFGGRRHDEDAVTYGVEHQWRPFPSMDFRALYDHNVVPSARALVTYDLVAFRPLWRIRDGWHLYGDGSFSFYDDDNSFLRLEMENLWNLSESYNVWLGLHNSVSTTDEDSDLYWSPFWEQRHYLIAEIRRNFPQFTASLRGHFGFQKAAARDEEIQEFLNLRAQAQDQGDFSAGEGPDQDWNPLIGISANVGKSWDTGLEVNGTFTVNSTDAYTEHTVSGSVLYRF